MSNFDGDNVPQWKKDLIARLKTQNKKHNQTTIPSAIGQQPAAVASSVAYVPRSNKHRNSSTPCNRDPTTTEHQPRSPTASGEMVQERLWNDNKHDLLKMVNNVDDEDEDLSYGPGIVSKLKQKYQSLAHRQTNARPSILRLRKATSLENLLDDDDDDEHDEDVVENGNEKNGGIFAPRTTNGNDYGRTSHNRYRPAGRRIEMKRARSVEAISRSEDNLDLTCLTRSLHEDHATIKNDVAAPPQTNGGRSLNRPQRLRPIVSETERPPVDFVKQAKMFFEKSPERRTKKPPNTGDVAAKVDTFNSIIVKTKAATKKPPIKHAKPVRADAKSNTQVTAAPRPVVAKPVLIGEALRSPTSPTKPSRLQSQRIERADSPTGRPTALSIAKKSKDGVKETAISPIPDVSRLDNETTCDGTSLSETPDIILVSSPWQSLISPAYQKTVTEKFVKEEIQDSEARYTKPYRPQTRSKPSKGIVVTPPRVPQTGNDVSDAKTSPSHPVKVEVNGHESVSTKNHAVNGSSERYGVEVVNKIVLPKKTTTKREKESDTANTAVFNFTNRKDVPDYIANDTSRTPLPPQMPKAGEGGIILIGGGSTQVDSFVDEEEEIMRSLERPPSPCDVDFVNDNVIIDGKSSLRQRTTNRVKLKIAFVDDDPDVYEYPSEDCALLEVETPTSPISNGAQLGRTVPTFTGSTLANYTPKSGGGGDFRPGVTKSLPPKMMDVEIASDLVLEEVEVPVTFSSGQNTDMLF